MKLKYKKLIKNAIDPQYQTEGSSGFDLASIEDVILKPFETKAIKTGLSFEIPKGYEIQIRPRSGLSLKTGLRLANSVGTIDSDYRGEVKILLWNASFWWAKIKVGQRIAQGVLSKVSKPIMEECEELSTTKRGSGGFGSTGK